MKVWKPVGAVAIYSPARAAGVALGATAVLVGAGVGIGLAAGDGGGDGKTASTAVPATSSASAPPTASEQVSNKADGRALKRSYRRGFKAGSRSAAGKGGLAGDFRPGAAYVIRLAPGTGLRVAQRVAVEAGKSYFLCSGGKRLCVYTPR